MSERIETKRICPYLGVTGDPVSRFGYPEGTHRCFSAGQQTTIPLEHQSAFCLAQRYLACPRFVELPTELPPVEAPDTPKSGLEPEIQAPADFSLWWTILWGGSGLVAGLLIIFGIFYYSRLAFPQDLEVDIVDQDVLSPTDTPTAMLIPTEPVEQDTLPPVAVALAPTPTATPGSDFKTYALSPAASDIGWVTDGEERGNHFGDSYLYAGIFQGRIYNGAFQFDLSSISRGAPIEYAAIQMIGLRDDRLAVHNDQSSAAGVWTLRMLAPEIDQNWRRHNFQDIFNVSALQTLRPILSEQDLAEGKINTFELSPAQIKILEERIIDVENPTISFRIEGPLVGPDNLFGWDTGYGPRSRGNEVTLVLNVGLPPATPPAYDFIVVTSTPTPENVMTVAAVLAQTTAEATRFGTATPAPPNMVTPTPIPDYLVIVPTPTAGNRATARALMAIGTAEALTTGTPTPIPTNAVTATPVPTETPTPTPPLPDYIIVTSTPTAETIFAAATQAKAATALAQKIGTPTPLPDNWVTPVVVTSTPTPGNEATAQIIVDLGTAIAMTTGTPPPMPPNMVTATPTPVFNPISFILTPTPLPAVDATPQSMPPKLLGKILFRSDREGEEKTYVFDPETGELGRLTADWPYYMAEERDAFSADTVFRAYTKQLLWTNERDELGNRYPTTEVAIHYYDYKYKEERLVTRMGVGIVYDAAWSPVGNEIAFVANESRNDEIWIIDYDGTNVRQLTHNKWQWDKSPSWSPDGKQIVFTSNRTGNLQLWVMNVDGSNQRLLMGWDNWTPYNDWSPVWVKYLDPAPPEDKKR